MTLEWAFLELPFVCSMDTESLNRGKQIMAGAVIVLLVGMLAAGLLIGRAWVPGLLGEWLGVVTGVMTTPFLLEFSFALIGLFIVLWLNHRSRKQDGDEFVSLAEMDGLEDSKPSLEKQVSVTTEVYPMKD
jgi:hypothetical protein